MPSHWGSAQLPSDRKLTLASEELQKHYNSKSKLSCPWGGRHSPLLYTEPGQNNYFSSQHPKDIFFTRSSEASVFLRTVVHFWSQSNVDGFHSIYTIFQLMASR